MKVALQFIRNALLSQESLEARRQALTGAKAVKSAAKALAVLGAAFTILDLHQGRIFRPLILLPLAYLAHETGVVADNFREIIDDPRAELRAACAGSHSNEKLWQLLTKEAPLAQKAGILYLSRFAKEEPPPVGRIAALRAWWKSQSR